MQSIRYLLMVLLLAASCFFSATAQVSDSFYRALPDSLRPANRLALSSLEKINLLRKLNVSFANHYQAELSLIVHDLQQAMQQEPSQRKTVLYALAIANYYEVVLDYHKALHYCEQAVHYAAGNSSLNKESAKAYLSMATYYAVWFKEDSALNFLYKGMSVAGEPVDNDLALVANNAYLLIYTRLLLYKQALHYTNECLRLLPATARWNDDFTFFMMDKAYLFMQLYKEEKLAPYADSSYRLLHQVIDAKKQQSRLWYMQCFFMLGKLQYLQGRYDNAIRYFDSSLMPAYTHFGFVPNEAKLYRGLCLYALGKPEGIVTLKQLKLYEKSFEQLQLQNQVLYLHAKSHGYWRDALQYYEAFSRYSDSIAFITQRGKIFESEKKYNAVQKEAHIAILQRDNLKARAGRVKIIVAGVLVVLLLVIIILLLYRYNKKQQMQRRADGEKLADELLAMEQQLETERLQQQQQRETEMARQRETISANIHDEVSSGLAALRFLISDLKRNAHSQETREVLQDVEDETNNVYLQSRNFIHQLSTHDTPECYDVTALLHTLSLRFGKDSSTRITVTMDEAEIMRRLDMQQHAEIYRVLKEAVTNSLKHSGATEIHVVLLVRENETYFEVRDNGKGMNNSKKNGMGISTIYNRIKTLNGNVFIETNQKGQMVSGSFPLEKNQTQGQ
ncbi:sensor histidine kinase [Foetidibacter luteolus]|uniref:sensor histidine kinase n=1 Tax=Foetidibacter luteolus TaxID=2608880 RepID=UPI00129B2F58|nr:ATP-binding protein [Foetidibacter luteolus]